MDFNVTQPIDELERLRSWFDRIFVLAKDLSDVTIGRVALAQCTKCGSLLQIDKDVLVLHYMYHARRRSN